REWRTRAGSAAGADKLVGGPPSGGTARAIRVPSLGVWHQGRQATDSRQNGFCDATAIRRWEVIKKWQRNEPKGSFRAFRDSRWALFAGHRWTGCCRPGGNRNRRRHDGRASRANESAASAGRIDLGRQFARQRECWVFREVLRLMLQVMGAGQ